ncbi:4-hydroxy-tetrahydrodipicolinate synthase [Halothiobacillus diazotrophicus]|uniref:4-hydroxy-tetrahydrodipicolinate synthase n=1 Tax=Halothiobacillus diazotrophicus TaxID=1860122 RepID=A0A191ZF59_9GAMM|nr:4-hydroxy-tetrahydrodipicolinate synthase [Halothiobacillus diazotrophicus]ANJ66516.1 4-hydroxy-tetrahydrodipicolinate synthase [Halothiobacillus diazotrophicus]
MSTQQIAGSLVALVTPMTPQGAVDYPRLERLIEFHIEQGTDGIVAVGTTGESATLDFDEHVAVIRATVEKVAGRIPVIAGTGANNTREAIYLGQAAKEAGADAHLSVTPYYNRPPQAGLMAHFRAIADAVDLPLILYNVPSRTGVDMSVETTLALAGHDRIIGTKEASGSLARMQALIDGAPEGFAIYSGEDNLSCAAILAGAKGTISVTANVAPSLMHRMTAAALSGQADEARAIDDQLQPLHRELFCQPNPIPVKWAVAAMGLAESAIRLPLVPLMSEFEPRVCAAMQAAGISATICR